MLDLDGHARLIDFGLSKLNVTDDISTFTKTLCGTNCYMAPEVVRKGEIFFREIIFLVVVFDEFRIFVKLQNFMEDRRIGGRLEY